VKLEREQKGREWPLALFCLDEDSLPSGGGGGSGEREDV
jgi:hypothetical protein